MKVIFMGTPDFAVGTLKALEAAGHEILAVVTQPDKPKGRGKALQPTPLKAAALKLGIPVLQPVKVREEAFLDQLETLEADVVVVAAFGQIIPKRLLEMTKFGCINVHASLLPAYRGAAPIQWAVINGEKESGVTIMQMDEGLDTGDMISRVRIPLEENETGGSLFDKLAEAGAALCVQTLKEIEKGQIDPEKQPADSTTDYASMITKAQGEIFWEHSADQIERLVRGLNPWPSAYTKLSGKNLKIWKSSVIPGNESGFQPGQVIRGTKEGIFVQTGDGVLCIKELQLEGKKRMDADPFLRGYSVEEGTYLGIKN